MRPTLRHVAWAAGFYEGEGSCGAYLPNPRSLTPLLTMKIVQVNREPLDRMHALFGGNESRWVRRETKRGYWQLQLNGARAIGFLLTIYSFLSPHRQAQIRAALRKVRTDATP